MPVPQSAPKSASRPYKQGRSLLRDRRGVAILEFAIVAPVFIFFLFAMIDAMWMLTVELAMHDGVQGAGRLGLLGAVPVAGTREAAIKSMMVQRAAGLLDTTKLTVTMPTFGSGSAKDYASRTGATTQTTGAGTSRQLLQYQVAYVQPLLTPIGIAYNGGSTITHNATDVVQNKPL